MKKFFSIKKIFNLKRLGKYILPICFILLEILNAGTKPQGRNAARDNAKDAKSSEERKEGILISCQYVSVNEEELVYDANGNILYYINEQGEVVASYKYDAFGNALKQSGSQSNTFNHRFSTKYYDNETGCYYYGYRFYSPVFGRWLNHDLIEEEGGTEGYIKDCLRNFAKQYSGMWRYPFGQNCHTFQKEALKSCCLEE